MPSWNCPSAIGSHIAANADRMPGVFERERQHLEPRRLVVNQQQARHAAALVDDALASAARDIEMKMVVVGAVVVGRENVVK